MATQLQNLRFYGFSYCFSFVLFFIFVLVKSTAFFPAAAARKVTQNPKLIQFVFFLSTIRLFCVFPLFFFCFVACCAHNIRILCNNEFSIELNWEIHLMGINFILKTNDFFWRALLNCYLRWRKKARSNRSTSFIWTSSAIIFPSFRHSNNFPL